MPALHHTLFWNDLTPHSGAINMAIDELLLKRVNTLPILRIYQWSQPTISFGYFNSLASAKDAFPSSDAALSYIRRWTGGGIVDHRNDFTYTIILPKNHPMAMLRGTASYQAIHHSIMMALQHQQQESELTTSSPAQSSHACFTNPVAYDIITPTGKKLAGAAQKRSRYGLLHQGSIIAPSKSDQWSSSFITHLAKSAEPWQPSARLLTQARQLSLSKYASQSWIAKR